MKKSLNHSDEKANARILVAPLDWGLGHSTRCIPIIKELISEGCEVLIAADKKTYVLLKKEFPGVVFLRYKGYEIEYSRQKNFLSLKLALQAPKIFLRIFHEKRWLKRTIKRYKINAVISDNRFGMHNKKIHSVYITHQLFIKTGNRFIEKIAQKVHYHFIKKYSVCWVPDEEKNGLAGRLSHPKKIPGNVKYIGPLSRFSKLPNVQQEYDLLIMLSGPEPQRSILEKKIISQIKDLHKKIFFIRGLPGEETKPENFNNTIFENHVDANTLNQIMAQSKMVLCRSGYTSIMDLAVLGKEAILIPTPGQTEQEYLAKYLMEKRFFLSMQQKDFSIKKALELAADFYFNVPEINAEEYKTAVSDLINDLRNSKTENLISQ